MAGNGLIGSLRVTLGANTAEFDRAMERTRRGVADTTSRLGSLGKQAATAGNALRAAFAGLAMAGAAKVAGSYLSIADEAKSLTAQLKLATAQSGNFAVAMRDVQRIADDTRGGLSETASLYGNFVRASNEMGVSQAQAARATETFAKALKIGGADANAAASATLQFGQALASGVLRGDEFNSVNEASPRIMRLLADSMGIPIGQLRSMAEEGKLTSDVLFHALTDQKFTAGIDAEFREMPVTFDQAMTLVRNAAVTTFGAFDEAGEFSTIIADFVGRGADGFASLADSAANEAIEIRATFAGLSDVFEPMFGGAQDAFGGIRQEAEYTRQTIATLLGWFDKVRNVGIGIDRGVQWIDNLNPLDKDDPLPAWSDKRGAFLRGYDRQQGELNDKRTTRNLDARWGQGWQRYLSDPKTFNMFGNRITAKTDVKVDKDVEKYQGQIADLEKLKASASGAELKQIQSQIDQRQRILKNLQKGAGIDAARAAASGGGGSSRSAETERKRQEREGLRKQEEAERLQRRYDAADAQEREALLRARMGLTVEVADRRAIEQRLREDETATRLATIANDDRFTDAQKAHLSSLVRDTAALEQQLATRTAQELVAREALDAAQASNENQQDVLSAHAGLARTAKERAALELQILDLQFQQQRAVQQAVIQSQTSTAQEKKLASDRILVLNELQGLAAERSKRSNAGPLMDYINSVPRTRDEMNEAMEDVSVRGLDSLIDGIASATTDFESLGKTFTNISNSIIADLARIALRRALVGTLGRILGIATATQPNAAVEAAFGTGTAGTVDLNPVDGLSPASSILSKYGGGRARGGPIKASDWYMVGEEGPELFAPGVSGTIIPNGGLSRGGTGKPTVVQLVVGEGQMFVPRVESIAGPVSVQTVRSAGRSNAIRNRQTLS